MERALNARLARLKSASEMAVNQSDPEFERSLRILSENPAPTGSEATDGLVAQIRELQSCTLRILRRAEAAGRTDTALKVIREVRSNMELLARLTGRLDQSGPLVTSVIVMPGPSVLQRQDKTGSPGQVIDIVPMR